MLKEFKVCTMGGSVVDMAAGIISAAFSATPVKAVGCPHHASALHKG